MNEDDILIDFPQEACELVNYYLSIGAGEGQGADTTRAKAAAALGWSMSKIDYWRNRIKHHLEWGVHLSSRMGTGGRNPDGTRKSYPRVVVAISEMLDGVPTGKMLIGVPAVEYAQETLDRGMVEAVMRFGVQALQDKALLAGQAIRRGLAYRMVVQRCDLTLIMLRAMRSSLDTGSNATRLEAQMYVRMTKLINQLA